MKLKTTFISSVFLLLFIVLGCSKEEGYGGNSTVKGTLIEHIYNDDYSQLIYERRAAEEDIYIVFEEEGTISDKTTTDYMGQFEFKNLFPGNYKIYYYSDDIQSAYNDNKEVVLEIELKKNSRLELDDLIKVNSIEYNEGSAQIKGRVFLINYLNSSEYPNLVVKDTSFAQDEEIYLQYGNHTAYDDRIRTNFDGRFYFENLIKGSYTIFLYSEDLTGATEDIVITRNVVINSEFEEINLGDIYIEQL